VKIGAIGRKEKEEWGTTTGLLTKREERKKEKNPPWLPFSTGSVGKGGGGRKGSASCLHCRGEGTERTRRMFPKKEREGIVPREHLIKSFGTALVFAYLTSYTGKNTQEIAAYGFRRKGGRGRNAV